MDGTLIILKEYDLDVAYKYMDFKKNFLGSNIWYPLLLISASNALVVGAKMGDVIKVDFNIGGFNQMVQVLVFGNSRQCDGALFPDFILENVNGSASWIQIKNEKLSDFCF